MATSTTFKVSDVKVERVTNLNVADLSVDYKIRTPICSQLRAYERNHCSEVWMETKFSALVAASRNNGFIRTVIECYNKHHNLVIRPDDIWTAIMTQFSFYIKNSGEFRSQFAKFDKKNNLEIKINGTLRAPFDFFVTSITEQINKRHVDKSVKDWILPDFTTTTTDDIISCGIVIMTVTKKYFDYIRRGESCGIPYITLEGTVADWENILYRLDKLKCYKLEKWYDMLKPILDEFINAKKNQANVEFWNRMCYYVSSGAGLSCISGWITAFAAFNEYGQDCVDLSSWRFSSNTFDECLWPVIESSTIPSGSATVNVKIVDGVGKYESVMFAGHIAYEVLDDDFTLRPRIGWGIALKSTADEVEKLHEIAKGNGDFKCDACKAFFKDQT